MSNLWDSLKATGESLGGAAVAPVGVLWDLATMPFDDKDDDFGSSVAKVGRRASDLADPIFGQEALTAKAFHKTMQGLEWAYREGVSEPLVSVNTMHGHGVTTGNWQDVFSGEKWGEAYAVAQDRSIGQSLVLNNPFTGSHEFGSDPLERRAYEQLHENARFLTSMESGTYDFTARWFLDPGIVIGKGAKFAQLRPLSRDDRAALFEKTLEEKTARLGGVPFARFESKGLATRTERVLEFLRTGADGRPLNEAQAFFGLPELARSSEGRTIAGLLADAARIEDRALSRDAMRTILSVAGGDYSRVAGIKDELADVPALADKLTNVLKGNTLDLKAAALAPSMHSNPLLVASLERQVRNLDAPERIEKFVSAHIEKMNVLLDTAGTMRFFPTTSAAGRRAVSREAGEGLLRSGQMASGFTRTDAAVNKVLGPTKAASDAMVERAKRFATYQATDSLFQKSARQVPLRVIQSTGLIAAPFTKGPIRLADALRTPYFVGMANVHDWEGSTNQLNVMMRLGGVDDGKRMEVLSKVQMARTEVEKQRAIVAVENLAMGSLVERASRKAGHEVDRAYVEQLMLQGARSRQSRLTALQGRAYAATQMPEELMALRGTGVQAAQDAATGAASKGSAARRSDDAARWRVDQIDDDGIPVAIPVLDTQLANNIPLLDMNLARKVVERDTSHMSRLSKAWRREARELDRLSSLKAAGASTLDNAINARRIAMDYLIEAGQTATRLWKFEVLFRLGYPMRVVMDDHMRIWTQINALTFYSQNGREAGKNLAFNQVGRRREAAVGLREFRARRRELLDQLDDAHLSPDQWEQLRALRHEGTADASRRIVEIGGPRVAAYYERLGAVETHTKAIAGLRASISNWKKAKEETLIRRSLGGDASPKPLDEKIANAERQIADHEGARSYLQDVLGDDPEELSQEISALEVLIDKGSKSLRPEKRTVGSAETILPGGFRAEGAFAGPYGKAVRDASSSDATFDAYVRGSEDRTFRAVSNGSFRTYQNDDPGHLRAWSDTLNYQFRQSDVAMFFIKGGEREGFVRWLRKPEQRELRKRMSHLSHDGEGWAWRVEALVNDYLPTQALREKVVAGNVSPDELGKMFQDVAVRPAVHGASVGDNLGISERARLIENTIIRMYRYLGELPTDRLSRHPYFASLYRQHMAELHDAKRAAHRKLGKDYSQADVDELTGTARKNALRDLKRTLFDISSHSNAAHFMRFVSPFFAAHQESLARWWRIANDDPSVIRRFQQGFDMPRKLELVIDQETGEPVKSGEPVSSSHRILFQVPRAWGGPTTDTSDPDAVHSSISLNENSFNLMMQGGLLHPGAGPVVSFPLEWAARKYADEPEIAKVARLLSSWTPNSPYDTLMSSSVRNIVALVQGEKSDQYSRSFGQNVQDRTVAFIEANDREPNRREADAIMLAAGRETNVEMWLRLGQSLLSPAPAQYGSEYSAIQHGWNTIYQQSQTLGEDFDWAYERFRERYGDAYLPLIYSTQDNPAGVPVTTEGVGAYKRHSTLLKSVDPALARMVIGPEGEGEYSSDARAFFSNTQMRHGSADTYLSTEEAFSAQTAQMAQRGWRDYNRITSALSALAFEQGFDHWSQSDTLVGLKKVAVESLAKENYAWWDDYNSFDRNRYDRYLDDMRQIADDPKLNGDTARGEVQVLKVYLALRQVFTRAVEIRAEMGRPGTMEADANADLRRLFTFYVAKLTESNIAFERYFYDGIIERDPYLTGVTA